MANKKRPQTGSTRALKKSSTGRSIALVALGVAAALAAAVYLSSGGAGPTTTALDAALLADTGGGHVRGPENPAVTLIEYGDYECPTCATFHPIVSELMRRMPSELELEFHHYPIPVGANSITAAAAAEAAGEQGRYWDMHDALYDTQSQWRGRANDPELFVSMAGQLGLDTDRFREDIESQEILARIMADRQRGDRAGVAGTPTFFINGRRLDYLPAIDEFESIIRSVMGR